MYSCTKYVPARQLAVARATLVRRPRTVRRRVGPWTDASRHCLLPVSYGSSLMQVWRTCRLQLILLCRLTGAMDLDLIRSRVRNVRQLLTSRRSHSKDTQ